MRAGFVFRNKCPCPIHLKSRVAAAGNHDGMKWALQAAPTGATMTIGLGADVSLSA